MEIQTDFAIGKIQVINSLIASQFVYKMSCLPSPTQEMFRRINKLIREFLWDGKSAKIAYNTLIREIEEGGLKLCDIVSKDKPLKLIGFINYINPKHLDKSITVLLPHLHNTVGGNH